MKIIAKMIAAMVLLVAMASCSNHVKDAKAAIEKENYVEAANCLSKVSVSDINGMDLEELQDFCNTVDKALNNVDNLDESVDAKFDELGAAAQERAVKLMQEAIDKASK